MVLADATATVVQQVFARLIRDGVLSPEIFETIAATYDQMADDTHIQQKRADAMAVADVARIIVNMADRSTGRPRLSLVRNDEPPEED